jgi:hypothetical protein
LGATPIEQVRPVRSWIAAWIVSASVPAALRLSAFGGAEVDIDLVDAAILDHRRQLGDHGLEQA